jgi:D-sedoheptulose 7-phosphate isomerase
VDCADYLEHATDILRVLPVDAIEQAVDHIFTAYQADQTIFIIGNGGSAAAAAHLAQDLAKGVVDRTPRRPIRALSLTDNGSFITAVANDESYDSVFTAQLDTFAKAGDVLIAISASGRSRNILQAAALARSRHMSVIAVTGGGPSPLYEASDFAIRVPVVDVGLIEGVHAIILHYVITSLRARITGVVAEPSGLVPLVELNPL